MMDGDAGSGAATRASTPQPLSDGQAAEDPGDPPGGARKPPQGERRLARHAGTSAGASRLPVTCFELDTDCPGEALRVHRLAAVAGVELWSISHCQRRRFLLTDMFSACLVRMPGAGGQWWVG